MLRWIRKGMGSAAGGSNAVFGALDVVFNPGAARAREQLREQHERVIPIPSPGDKLLNERRVVLRRTGTPDDDEAQAS